MSINDKQLEELLAKARKRHGYCPLTPEESLEAFEKAPEVPLPEGFIQSVLKQLSGENHDEPEPVINYDWMDESKFEDVQEGLMQLHRNKGDNGDSDDTEDSLRNEMLSDDDDEDGMVGETGRLDKAGTLADDIISVEKLIAPIDPHDIIRSERTFLRASGADFGNRYDGKLEYHRSKNRFLLFYNTKYDDSDRHHPRTRFSICHELGHYFIDRHRAYLMSSKGKPHGSHAEFTSDILIESEADAFAASLLLPTKQVKPVINRQALSMQRIYDIAGQFDTSLICTASRAVRLSHFNCAVAGIRDGLVQWMVTSQSLIDYGIYPQKGHLPESVEPLWQEFKMGILSGKERQSSVADWFQIFDDRFAAVHVTEEYVPIGSMSTILVLLTMHEDDFEGEDEGYDED